MYHQLEELLEQIPAETKKINRTKQIQLLTALTLMIDTVLMYMPIPDNADNLASELCLQRAQDHITTAGTQFNKAYRYSLTRD